MTARGAEAADTSGLHHAPDGHRLPTQRQPAQRLHDQHRPHRDEPDRGRPGRSPAALHRTLFVHCSAEQAHRAARVADRTGGGLVISPRRQDETGLLATAEHLLRTARATGSRSCSTRPGTPGSTGCRRSHRSTRVGCAASDSWACRR